MHASKKKSSFPSTEWESADHVNEKRSIDGNEVLEDVAPLYRKACSGWPSLYNCKACKVL